MSPQSGAEHVLQHGCLDGWKKERYQVTSKRCHPEGGEAGARDLTSAARTDAVARKLLGVGSLVCPFHCIAADAVVGSLTLASPRFRMTCSSLSFP